MTTITIKALPSVNANQAFIVSGTYTGTILLTSNDDSSTVTKPFSPLGYKYAWNITHPGLPAGRHTITITDSLTKVSNSRPIIVKASGAKIKDILDTMIIDDPNEILA